MRKTLFTVLVGFLVTIVAVHAQYQILGTDTERVVGLKRTETTIQVGTDPLNQFKMIRLVKQVPVRSLRGSILLLPALGPSAAFFEQRDPSGTFGTSIMEYFAQRGYDVYAYGPRYDGIPAGTCEAGLIDCSVMATWDLQSMAADVLFLRSQIELLHPGSWVVVGGHALGAMAAIAAVNTDPAAFDGVVLWEGLLYTSDPEAMALDQAYCAAYEELLAAGVIYDDVSMNVFRQLGHLAGKHPSAMTVNPLFPPGLTNHQAMVIALSVPDPSNPISMVVPTYVIVSGVPEEDRFMYSSDARIVGVTKDLCDYLPAKVVSDIVCSIGGLDDQYIANLGSFTGPVLAIGGGRGYGPYMQHQLDLFGSQDVTFLFEPGFGLFDHFGVEDHVQYLERPIRGWLQARWP